MTIMLWCMHQGLKSWGFFRCLWAPARSFEPRKCWCSKPAGRNWRPSAFNLRSPWKSSATRSRLSRIGGCGVSKHEKVKSDLVILCNSNIMHRPRGLPRLQDWGFPVVEHEKRNCRKYCVYAVFSAFGFRVFRVLGFRVRRLVNTKTLALRRFLSMSKSKDNIWTPF